MVETGTLFGFSTMALCEGVLRSGVRKKIYTVDNYSWNPFGVPMYRHRMITRQNLALANSLTDLVIVDSSGDYFYKDFSEIPYFAFIDGDHIYESVKKGLDFLQGHRDYGHFGARLQLSRRVPCSQRSTGR